MVGWLGYWWLFHRGYCSGKSPYSWKYWCMALLSIQDPPEGRNENNKHESKAVDYFILVLNTVISEFFFWLYINARSSHSSLLPVIALWFIREEDPWMSMCFFWREEKGIPTLRWNLLLVKMLWRLFECHRGFRIVRQ